MKRILVVLFAVVLLAGCITIAKENSSIWFDNKSDETITCYVDGKMVSTVDPGKREIYSVAYGEHKWEAKSEKNYWHGTVDLRWGEITNLVIQKPGS